MHILQSQIYQYQHQHQQQHLYSGQCGECNVGYADLAALIRSASVPQYVRVPYKGYRDGTYVNGIQINQPCSETDELFEICFDKNQVGGTQARGTIGLRDTWGNGDACVVQNTLPDFCGGVTPEPTNKPTDRPTTAEPTYNPTKKPTTAEPTARPTDHPTTASYVYIICIISCVYI